MAETNTPAVSNRGAITVCVILATLMQALDTTIANVALPYMQGSVSASQDQIAWVLTDYKLLMIATLAVVPLLIVFKKSSSDAGADHVVMGE